VAIGGIVTELRCLCEQELLNFKDVHMQCLLTVHWLVRLCLG